MRKVVTILTFALLCLPLFATDMTKLKIQVNTTTGKPIDRASVIVKFQSGYSKVVIGKKIRTSWEIRTNQEGTASIPAIPQGKILVQVIAKGHQTFGEVFDVAEAERTIEIKLNPPQSQYSAHQ